MTAAAHVPVISQDWLWRAHLRAQTRMAVEEGEPQPVIHPLKSNVYEVDQWLPSPLCHYVCCALSRGEDFTRLDDAGQRTFLWLVAEALFGPDFDSDLLDEVEIMANEPV